MNERSVPHILYSEVKQISSFIEEIIKEAHKVEASDIHIDQLGDHVLIRMRIDGILLEHRTLESSLLPLIVGRIKILSGLRGDTHDKSQDGRFSFERKGEFLLDVRVSIAPTYYGENIVLRIIYQAGQKPKRLHELGMDINNEGAVEHTLSRPQGLIIVAGPTGSGKTSTLYSMLNLIVPTGRMIVSLEDPVEYPLSGVRQIQLKQENGYGFKEALRGILRQDPDVIMLGEMRDKETASIAINIALTGHLVMTSLHAEDALHVIPRLIDMGIDPYLLSATLRLVIAQRLVRKIDVSAGILNDKGKDSNREGTIQYKGREGVFEVLHVTDKLKKSFFKKPTVAELKTLAKKEGFISMKEFCVEKIDQGITTEEELRRVFA